MMNFLSPSFRRQVDTLFRLLVLFTGIALVVLALASVLESLGAYAAEPAMPKIELNVQNASPREVEETTRAAIAREYANAWKAMSTALAANTTDGLAATFVGAAMDTLTQRVAQQKESGLATRIVDRGHKLDVVFYSPEGSAMQLRDTATLERQLLHSGSIVHSDTVTRQYMVLMSVSEDRWKVRVLQEMVSIPSP